MSCFRITGGVLAVLVTLFAVWLETSFLKLDNLVADHDVPWKHFLNVDNFDWDDGKRPLKIVFLTWGSRGDHQPNVALGLELARRGHDVTVMGMERYRNIIERHRPKLTYVPLFDNNLWKLADAFGKSQGTDFISLTKEYVIQSSREMVPQYIQAGQQQDADLLVGSHSAMLYLQHVTVAQVLKKPLIFLTHDLTLPTADYSFDAAESRVKDYGRRKNVFNHRIFGHVLGAALTFSPFGEKYSEMRVIRKELLGLDNDDATPWPWMEVPSPEVTADFPVFSTSDTTLWEQPPVDWPTHWYATGFFVTHDNGRETPESNAELQNWIDARKESHDRPLLYFGQGSFSHHDREVFTEILLDALDKLEMDAIVLASTIDESSTAAATFDHLKIVQDLDQELIFPQCVVVVHHGGAGSASQCIRSGTPGICIPSMPFQEIWGDRLEEYGAGVLLQNQAMVNAWTSSLPPKNRTNLLVKSVQRAMQPDVTSAAANLGVKARQVSEAKGVSFAAKMIEKHLQELRARQ